MGEAKRRSAEIAKLRERQEAWRAGLSPSEMVIAQTAERLDERLVRGRRFTEGCYYLAFFMTRFLAIRDIEVTPAVGWVNDGLWKGVTSHAWIEFDGKITDASMTLTTHPDAVPSGALIVQDFIVRPGRASYKYFKNNDPFVATGLDFVRTQPEWAQVLAYKEAQHLQMLEIIKENRIDEYLSRAPIGSQFSDIAALIN